MAGSERSSNFRVVSAHSVFDEPNVAWLKDVHHTLTGKLAKRSPDVTLTLPYWKNHGVNSIKGKQWMTPIPPRWWG